MSHTVVTTERAAGDIEEAAAWWAREHSVEQADHWYQAIRAAIAGLATFPERCPLAAESKSLHYEVRELHFGVASRPTHRIVFAVVRDTVLVLTVRHGARDVLRPNDLA